MNLALLFPGCSFSNDRLNISFCQLLTVRQRAKPRKGPLTALGTSEVCELAKLLGGTFGPSLGVADELVEIAQRRVVLYTPGSARGQEDGGQSFGGARAVNDRVILIFLLSFISLNVGVDDFVGRSRFVGVGHVIVGLGIWLRGWLRAGVWVCAFLWSQRRLLYTVATPRDGHIMVPSYVIAGL